MLQNKIYRNYTKEIFKTFLTILFALTIIAWTVRAVNFLDLIVENGYPVLTYFQYSFLNLFGILTKFIPLSFLLAMSIFTVKQMQENEFVILWTSGVRKVEIVHLFLMVSVFTTLFYLIFSIFITPTALNKSRQLLSDQKLSSFIPTIRVQQFSDSFSGLTFIVDEKIGNQVKNIFLQDNSNILKNITAVNNSKGTNTIIASKGIVEEKKMILFDGQIISSQSINDENDIIKFKQLNIDLENLESRMIKSPKIQETSTLKLIQCIKNNFSEGLNCKENSKKDILPSINRRIVLPFFIPVITLLSSMLLIKSRRKYLFNKFSIFAYSFLILLYAEIVIRYTGLSENLNRFFILSPLIFLSTIYFFIKYKFSREQY